MRICCNAAEDSSKPVKMQRTDVNYMLDRISVSDIMNKVREKTLKLLR